MASTTNIPWCDSTWNWSRGCDKVSPGCANCYITETPPFRLTGMKHGDPRVIASDATFNAPLAWNKKPWVCDECGTGYRSAKDMPELPSAFRIDQPEAVTCCGKSSFHRRRVFNLSLGDWLDPKIPVVALARALDIIRRCKDIDFLLLTKRPELWAARMEDCMPKSYCPDRLRPVENWIREWFTGNAPHNIWLGTTVEDRPRKDRIKLLRNIPAKVRFLSCEPLLEDLGELDLTGIHGVIVGGESGLKARPCNIEWIRSIKNQCEAAGVACFVKQMGSNVIDRNDAGFDGDKDDGWPMDTSTTDIDPGQYQGAPVRVRLRHPKGGDPTEWPQDLRLQQFPTP